MHLAAATWEPVRGQNGISFVPSLTLDETPADLDILFAPGGDSGTLKVMQDPKLIGWVADRARRAKLVASVCTGSMILGQAGVLRGKRATSHWATQALLKDFGATPVNQRVVWDGKLVTGAGVSAGLDLGLAVVAKLRDKTYAQGVHLLSEYAPQPPLQAGTPRTAPPAGASHDGLDVRWPQGRHACGGEVGDWRLIATIDVRRSAPRIESAGSVESWSIWASRGLPPTMEGRSPAA